jgi:hypothetical protein
MCNTVPTCCFSVSALNETVTDTELSDQYLCAAAAKDIFSKIVTSFSDLLALDSIGK